MEEGVIYEERRRGGGGEGGDGGVAINPKIKGGNRACGVDGKIATLLPSSDGKRSKGSGMPEEQNSHKSASIGSQDDSRPPPSLAAKAPLLNARASGRHVLLDHLAQDQRRCGGRGCAGVVDSSRREQNREEDRCAAQEGESPGGTMLTSRPGSSVLGMYSVSISMGRKGNNQLAAK
ncbi:hypothetical protein ACHAWF_015838, partial [Thalassiosira exigua]